MEPELFDIIIIDEASQVSIAQAFPALLRGKKIVVFGDKKQFSNVKAAHARTDANRDYLTRLRDVFINTVSDDPSKLIRMEKFNIKTSILEFFEYIVNFNILLQKHFRGYKEIISYSNRYFYSDSLQVMKIRGKPIDDVLKFNVLDHDGKTEPVLNTNTLEIEYIQDQLRIIVESGIDATVGIITPHTNQQKLLMEHISRMDESDTLFDDYNMKIMTFDTCQGEERDIIFYSMVATEDHDRLWGIFIKDLSSVDIEEEGKIKAQRLNVGFSRAKECMHFVLSKNIDQFKGSVGDALRHYLKTKENAKLEKSPEDTDQNSPMESLVLHWFYQSPFYKEFKDIIEFLPQFKLGEYLKQLDKMYNYPMYVVDFLMIYKNDKGREKKIVIEYDGFYEHFKNYGEIDETNYSQYYSDDDVYRQKVLSSYGYEFLRINKFNLGKDPIATLSKRLYVLVKKKRSIPLTINEMHSDIADLIDGDKRSCDNCHEIKESRCFPYKSKPLCLWCYEKINNRTLYKKRQELGIIDSTSYEKNIPTHKKPSIRQSGSLKPNCPLCKSQKSESKGIRRGRRRYVCKRCRHNWTVPL